MWSLNKICLALLLISCTTAHNSGGVHMLEEKGYRSLQDIMQLSPFKNKIVYVDIWGTRCIPCIEEFKFADSMKMKYANQNIEYLYLAVNYGYGDDSTRWAKMIHDKKLTGYNMLVSAELYRNIWTAIQDSVKDMYLIPHYILVDKHGSIAIADAARPSNDKKLDRQIRLTLSK
jgi:thiol-disulfide isomerase/thioredoxin